IDHDQEDQGQHRREVDRSRRREEPTEDAEVRLTDVVEEALDPVERRRIWQPQPARQDVDEDHEPVEPDEDVDERLDARDRVGKQHERGWPAHSGLVRGLETFSYAWLKKPRSSIRALSSADSSTSLGVSRKTLSAIRCIPPSSAYVSPLAKSISRFDSSESADWRLRITGTPFLSREATCCASLELRGGVAWT